MPPRSARRPPFTLADKETQPGHQRTIDIPISRLSTHTPVAMPVRVIHGRHDGPTLFVSAGVHGDEIIGAEVIRRLLSRVSPTSIHGTLLAIPVVNVFGFVTHDRYLPDRRDLNRSFPGSANGSLAGQLAHVFKREIIDRSHFGIDLHSAAVHRTNLPQIRVNPDSERAYTLGLAFGAPALIAAPLREGSLRAIARSAGVDMLLYEAGEALRFDEFAIRTGVKGILRVMVKLGMLHRRAVDKAPAVSARSRSTYWVRAPQGGVFRALRNAGVQVREGEALGVIADPFGDEEVVVRAKSPGIIIGMATLPVVNQGDALMHIAQVQTFDTADERIETLTANILADPLLDEDEVL